MNASPCISEILNMLSLILCWIEMSAVLHHQYSQIVGWEASQGWGGQSAQMQHIYRSTPNLSAARIPSCRDCRPPSSSGTVSWGPWPCSDGLSKLWKFMQTRWNVMNKWQNSVCKHVLIKLHMQLKCDCSNFLFRLILSSSTPKPSTCQGFHAACSCRLITDFMVCQKAVSLLAMHLTATIQATPIQWHAICKHCSCRYYLAHECRSLVENPPWMPCVSPTHHVSM